MSFPKLMPLSFYTKSKPAPGERGMKLHRQTTSEQVCLTIVRFMRRLKENSIAKATQAGLFGRQV